MARPAQDEIAAHPRSSLRARSSRHSAHPYLDISSSSAIQLASIEKWIIPISAPRFERGGTRFALSSVSAIPLFGGGGARPAETRAISVHPQPAAFRWGRCWVSCDKKRSTARPVQQETFRLVAPALTGRFAATKTVSRDQNIAIYCSGLSLQTYWSNPNAFAPGERSHVVLPATPVR